MQTLGWYLNRMRRMSMGEVVHRGRNAMFDQIQKHGGLRAEKVPPGNGEAKRGTLLTTIPAVDAGIYLAAADEICAGRVDLLAERGLDVGMPPRWNRDPMTGIEAPEGFGPTLDYRDQRRVGNIKYLWELNRHLHLVTLAQAWRLSGERRYLVALHLHLESWFEQCPYLQGPNWTSALELGLRLISWAAVWRLIGGDRSPLFEGEEGETLRRDWLASVFRHVDFIRSRYSRFSSANNHRIGEAAGVAVASGTWPLWREMEQWRCEARAILAREAARQVAPDGVLREQATGYQQFVLDLLLTAGLWLEEDGGEPMPAPFWQRVEAMADVLASLMDRDGNLAQFGDSDEGCALRLYPGDDSDLHRSLIVTTAVLCQRPDLARKASRLDDRTRWLVGNRVNGMGAGPWNDSGRLPRRAFPHGGYYVLGDHFGTRDELHAVVDAGPLGYLSIAAHGHADALSLVLSVGGREILIDPGTYAYHTERRWRDWFRGTRAHNTVTVDGVDQSVTSGAFLWTHHAQGHCDHWESGEKADRFEGHHDGYLRLADPVLHRRMIAYAKDANNLRITDRLECNGQHRVERWWHFAEQCRVSLSGASITVERDGVRLLLQPGEAVEAELFHGDATLPAGWRSRRFGVKVPAPAVVWRGEIRGESVLQTGVEWTVDSGTEGERHGD